MVTYIISQCYFFIVALGHAVRNSDIVVSLLPATAHLSVAHQCLQYRKHLVTASYISPQMKALHVQAAAAGLSFVNEIGTGWYFKEDGVLL